jgi:hypothetical protein
MSMQIGNPSKVSRQGIGNLREPLMEDRKDRTLIRRERGLEQIGLREVLIVEHAEELCRNVCDWHLALVGNLCIAIAE